MSENINIKSDRLTNIARGQAVVETRQPIESDCRILSVYARAVTAPSEIFAGEVRYVGKVTFDCLVKTDDAVECITATAEFSDKITSAAVSAGTSVVLIPEVVNAEASLDGGNIKLIAVVDTVVLAVIGEQCACLTETDDGIYAEKQRVNYCSLAAFLSETVYITDNISAGGAFEILFTNSRAAVTDVSASIDAIKISGAVYTDIAVKTAEGAVSAYHTVTPFVKDIAVSDVTENSVVFAYGCVADATAGITSSDGVDLAVTLTLYAVAFDRKSCDAVIDVFCADYETEKATASLKCQTAQAFVSVSDTIDGQIPIPGDKPAADSVLCVSGAFCTLTAVKIEDGRVIAEGLIGGDIVYSNAEKNAVDSHAFRLPFSMPLSAHVDAQNVIATASVTNVSVRIRRESVFDIKADVTFMLLPTSDGECEFVESVKRGAELPRPDATVIVHIAKPGETLWQAARALCCSPENVLRQNGATPPYVGGEKLVNFCNKSCR